MLAAEVCEAERQPVAHLTETHRELGEDEDEDGATAVYWVTGEVVFACSNDL